MSAIFVNKDKMRSFTGLVGDLHNLMYAIKDEIHNLNWVYHPEAGASWPRIKTAADIERESFLNAELAYLEAEHALPGNGDLSIELSPFGINYPNTSTITFPDYGSAEYLANIAAVEQAALLQQKEEARLRFKRNVQSAFLHFLLPFNNGVYRFPEANDEFTYGYLWNWFEQEHDTNPILDRIIFPITAYDAAWGIPSNPEAYNSNADSYAIVNCPVNETAYTGAVGVIDPINPDPIGTPVEDQENCLVINPYTNPDVFISAKTNPHDWCTDGYHRDYYGNCIPDVIVCPTGYHRDTAGNCVPEVIVCPTGYHRDSAGNCVIDVIACPTGYHRDSAGNCVIDTVANCETGFHKDAAGNCVANALTCPTGQTLKNGVCVTDVLGTSIKPIYLIIAGAVVLFLLTRKSKKLTK